MKASIFYLTMLAIKLALVVFLVSGCTPKPIITSDISDSTSVKDSISYVEKVRLDTVYMPGESIFFEIPCDEKKSPKVKVDGKRSSVSLTRGSDGVVRGVADCSGLQTVVVAKDREIFQLKDKLSKKQEVKTITKEVYKTRWYDIASRWIAAVAVLLAAFRIVKIFI